MASDEDLSLLAHEARTRGLSLGRMLGTIVAERADQLRKSRRPRLATFSAGTSIATAAEREQPAAREFRSG